MHHHLKTHHHPFIGVIIAFVLFFAAAGIILRATDKTLTQQETDNYQIAHIGMIRSR